MGEEGFLKMLNEVSGCTMFDQRINGMVKSIEETQNNKQQLQAQLDQIQEKLEKLKEEIEVFEGYEQAEKVKKAYERILYYNKLVQTNKQIQTLLDAKKELLEEREQMIRNYEEMQSASPSKSQQDLG